jgi:hypothetical protein
MYDAGVRENGGKRRVGAHVFNDRATGGHRWYPGGH